MICLSLVSYAGIFGLRQLIYSLSNYDNLLECLDEELPFAILGIQFSSFIVSDLFSRIDALLLNEFGKSDFDFGKSDMIFKQALNNFYGILHGNVN